MIQPITYMPSPDELDVTTRQIYFVCALLVFLMQAGFLLLETGNVRVRNMSGIAIKNFMMLLASSLIYSFIGFRLMWGDSVGSVFGWCIDLDPSQLEWLFYQTGLAAVAATIVSGALAGRTTLVSNVVAACAMTLIVYPIYGHWMWGSGWLNTHFAVHDWAGSGVVHFVGGLAALIGAVLVGPRRGWVDEVAQALPEEKSLPLASLGVIFLWIGWMGFNSGGAIPIGSYVLSTCMAASAGGFAALAMAAIVKYIYYVGDSRISLLICLRERLIFNPFALLAGAMGGMVAVTCVCNLLEKHNDAIWVGMCGGIVTYVMATYLRHVCHVDDPVDAIAVHAGGGATGMIYASVLSSDVHFSAQLLALLAAAVWTSCVMIPLFLFLRGKRVDSKADDPKDDVFTGILRCSDYDEDTGLTFEPRISRPPEFPLRTKYVAQDLRADISSHLAAIVAGPIHRLEQLAIDVESLSATGMASMLRKEATRRKLFYMTSMPRKGATRRKLLEMASMLRKETTRRKLHDVASKLRKEATRLKLLGQLRKGDLAVSMYVLLRKLRSEYESRDEFSKVDFQWRWTKGETYSVQAQDDLMYTAVASLVSNAAKAAVGRFGRVDPDRARTVACTLSTFGRHTILRVADSGPGVHPKVRRRMFEPFASRDEGDAHGLGLFFAEYVAATFQGQITTRDSAELGGAEFRLIVPNKE